MTDLRGLAGPMGPAKHIAKVGHLLQGFPGSQGQARPNKSAFPGPGAGAAGVARHSIIRSFFGPSFFSSSVRTGVPVSPSCTLARTRSIGSFAVGGAISRTRRLAARHSAELVIGS